MAHFSSDLARTVRRQHGVVSGSQLRSDGLSPETIERLRLRRLLTRCHRDLYRIAPAPFDFEARCVVACLADPHVVIGGPSAALLWDLDHVFRPFRPEALVPPGIGDVDRVPATTYRHVRLLDDADVVDRPDSIRVTGRAHTWLECAQVLEPSRAAELTAHVVDSQCDVGELWDVTDRFERRRRGAPGIAHRLLSSRPEWGRRTASAARVAA